jgi:signal transduction histidine kinase/ligand-binding sensor domain-containing protein
MAKVYKIIFFLFFFLGIIFSQNQNASTNSEQDIQFEHLSVDDGLSTGFIRCIVQDFNGFLWIGTENGLNKFDGYKFTVYKHDNNNPASISDNLIQTIFVDYLGDLWIGTLNGLNKYDRNLDQFIRYQHDPENLNSISNDVIQCIHEDHTNNLWIGTARGLNLYNQEYGKFISDALPEVADTADIRSIYEDKNLKLWISTYIYGIFKYNKIRKFEKKYTGLKVLRINRKADCNETLSNTTAMHINETSTGQLLLGTYHGLNKYDRINDCFKSYFFDKHVRMRNYITQIVKDNSNNIWIGTGIGVHKVSKNSFNKKKLNYVSFYTSGKNSSNLSSDAIYKIFLDISGTLWIGTRGGGINKYSPKGNKFITYKKMVNNPKSLSGNFVNCFYTSRSDHNKIWIGTNQGLNKFDRNTKDFKQFKHDPQNPYSLGNNHVTSIYPDTVNGRPILWLGTWSGVNWLDIQSEKFYSLDGPGIPWQMKGGIYKITKDSRGTIWFGTGEGLVRYDIIEKSKNIKKYSIPDSIKENVNTDNILTIFEDRREVLWIGTQSGLVCFNQKTKKTKYFINDPDVNSTISNNAIYTIYEDRNGILWIGTSFGLNKFNQKTEKFDRYFESDGLPSNAIRGILEDNNGNLWLSTKNGLSVFNPEIETFRNYNKYDGLQSNEFNWGAYYKCPETGEMIFGGVNGFNIFYPDSIRQNTYVPPVVITDFKIHNNPVSIKGKLVSADSSIIDSPLKKQISKCDSIILAYDQNYLSFEFAALDFNAPQKNMYAYKMEGVDHDWVYTDASRRYATYTQLNHGEYTFRVKGSNNDGVWNEEGTSIKIIIFPPWWQTWWFRTIIIIILIGLLYWLFKYRTAVLRKKHQSQKEFSHKLIESQEKERKRIATALHDSHGQNLLIISNEMQQYVDKHKESEKELKNVSNTIQESINEIREISYDLHPHILERVGLSETIDSMIGKICKSSEIQFDLVMDEIDNLFDKKVEINIYRIIQEAVNNIIKHSQATESKIELKKNIKYVNINISDNGIGFDNKLILKENNGLGLVGMKERVNLINGKYRLKSEQGKGTKIEIKIPFKT